MHRIKGGKTANQALQEMREEVKKPQEEEGKGTPNQTP